MSALKVKRRKVNWYQALLDANIPSVWARYYLLIQSKKIKSKNRCAYNALKTYYSTTAMTRYRFTGAFL